MSEAKNPKLDECWPSGCRLGRQKRRFPRAFVPLMQSPSRRHLPVRRKPRGVRLSSIQFLAIRHQRRKPLPQTWAHSSSINIFKRSKQPAHWKGKSKHPLILRARFIRLARLQSKRAARMNNQSFGSNAHMAVSTGPRTSAGASASPIIHA